MSMFTGLFSGGKGSDFQAGSTPLTGNFSQGGADESYNNALSGIHSQQDLVNALNAQNGLGNQASVFNQLQGVANGTGPNPAQAMLNQSTGQNVANQAALMASQRGVSANPGMIARQAAQQGANTQQQAAGQAATLQAQQRLGALGQLSGVANQQVANQIGGVQGLNTAVQGQENIYNQGIANQNNANVAMQSNQNTSNAHIAGGNQSSQSGILGSLASGAGSIFSKGFGGGGSGGSSSSGDMNSTSAVGGSGQSTANSGANYSKGGQVKMADGGIIQPPQYNSYLANSLNSNNSATSGSQALLTNASSEAAADNTGSSGGGGGLPGLGGMGGMSLQGGLGALGGLFGAITGPKKATATDASGQALAGSSGAPANSGSYNPQSGAGSGQAGKPPPLPGGFAKGGKVPAMVSPGEIYLSPDKAKKVAEGKMSPLAGERIPGKAKINGDSLKNDVVPKTLEEGGVVIKRSKALGDDVARKAQEFVAAVMAHQGMKGKKR